MQMATGQGERRAAATLTYCTNVHAGETLAQVERSLDEFVVPVARRFVGDASFPVGLFVSAATASELAQPDRCARFADFLAQRRLTIATFNCFPFGGFHRERVKRDVYRPSWLESARVDFTLQAARVAATLVPAGSVVPISTLAGACKLDGNGPEVHRAIASNLALVAAGLARLFEETGREVVLCLEPEPFTTIETSAEAVAFFSGPLASAATRASYVAAGGASSAASEALRRHLGLCYDCCHQAVEFEAPELALGLLAAAGVRIGKMQLSSALVARSDGTADQQLSALRRFVEPRWLHQSFVREANGRVAPYLDLDEGITAFAGASVGAELRVHYHVPIDRAQVDGLLTTRGEWIQALRISRRLGLTDCFEVETYTLPTLPGCPSPADVVDALTSELDAARRILATT